MKYIIKAPDKKYNGTSATVLFRDGTGNTDSEHLAEWFGKHGYEVIESEPEAPKEEEQEQDKTDESAGLDLEEKEKPKKTRTKKKDAEKEAENPEEE